MKRHISFGSIEQFRNAIVSVSQRARYAGKDENGNAKFDKQIALPTITVTGTEKIHGTNAAVCFTTSDGFWVQSNSNIITPDNDNFGCARWVQEHNHAWMTIINALAAVNNIDLMENIISVFFEWCGGSIQKKSAVSNLEKRAIIFQHFKVSPRHPTLMDDQNAEDENAFWLETCGIDCAMDNIFNVINFPTYEFDVNFDQPSLSQNEMIARVDEIEAASPVGKHFGEEANIGEGIVCTFMFKDKLFRFKVKGEKHSTSKVKTLAPVDEEFERAKIEFANYACPSWRLEQAWDKVIGRGTADEKRMAVTMTGDFLRAVIADVMKEEQDVMKEKGIEPKEANGMISKVARTWFSEQLDKEAGL